MESEKVTILLVGDEKCGKTSFLSCVYPHDPGTSWHSLNMTSRIIRRLTAGEGTGPVTLLRNIDQPYIFEVKMGVKPYRLEFYDNDSPESWRLLDPDMVVLCFDISQRLSLINIQRRV